MARHRASRRARGIAPETWLLLLGLGALIICLASMSGHWPFARWRPDRAQPLTMAQARASNAAVAIVADRRIAARPFHFRGGPAAREQATECLATAALYEAGDRRREQQAVIQIILNRVRAPGFPRTVCGVVYQGFARSAGCQFFFACDGSLVRRPVRTGWAAARRSAHRALGGRVFANVGEATHYHADWIVPYWRDTMIKVARIGVHVFYVRR